METIFNRKTREDLKDKVNCLKGTVEVESPRNEIDSLYSLVLQNKLLPSYKKRGLESFLLDLKEIPEENRVDKVLVFDTETTGKTGYVVSIAFILYSISEDKILEERYELINPQAPIEKEAEKVHLISEEKVKNKPIFADFWEEFKELFDKADMAVGQNLIFDLMVLEREFERMGIVNPIMGFPYFDTMEMGKDIAKVKDKNGRRVKNPKLEELVEFFDIKLEETDYHNALTDTKATLEVFKKMINYPLSEGKN